MTTALIISGGAPNMTYIAGALCAFEERKVKFDVISTCGAGALAGLLYLAPKGKSPIEALKQTVDFAVEDQIYNLFPVNYKVFQKPGAFADLYRQFTEMIFQFWKIEQKNDCQRYFNDWMQLVFSTFCPTNLNLMSKGLCTNLSVENIIDFSKLKEIEADFYISAYNITDEQMDIFSKKEITTDHLNAALSFPFIRPPYELNGKFYYEGAAIDALNYKGLLTSSEHKNEIKTIVVFDILGSEKLIRQPRYLFDAWVKSIIIPLVEVARDDTKLFELKYNTDNKYNLLKVPFVLNRAQWHSVLDWSYSNLKNLFDDGYDQGLNFYEKHLKNDLF